MKIFVMVDMEGISGICRRSQVSGEGAHYQDARKLLCGDVNACVEGCLAAGASRILVRDAHFLGFNFILDELHPDAEYIQGDPGTERMPGIKSFDGLILLGYHAMAGTPEAILEHTMTSSGWQNFHINGELSGEIAMDAGIAGDHGVPTIMVSGDDKTCSEARKLIPGVVTAQVKTGLSLEGGILLPLKKAHDIIRKKAEQAEKICRNIAPLKFRHPVTMRLELVSRGKIPSGRKGVRTLDGRTYEVKGQNVEDALRALL